jgi:predicted tellurium resistance membrane protein TerC
MRLLDRFPNVLYLGGAVLAWTAAKMIVSEPRFAEALDGRTGASVVIYAVAIGGVLGAAWLRRRRPALVKTSGLRQPNRY